MGFGGTIKLLKLSKFFKYRVGINRNSKLVSSSGISKF